MAQTTIGFDFAVNLLALPIGKYKGKSPDDVIFSSILAAEGTDAKNFLQLLLSDTQMFGAPKDLIYYHETSLFMFSNIIKYFFSTRFITIL